MQRLYTIFVILSSICLAIAASPPSFCRCSCFSNSTIVPLGPGHTSSSDEVSGTALLLQRAGGGGGSTCSKCNRAFCLSQGISFCKGAEEKDVFTTCFQRDSRKDQIIVLSFIAITVGLLAWAGVQNVLERRAISSTPVAREQYQPVGGRS